jgi:hypothetical protein
VRVLVDTSVWSRALRRRDGSTSREADVLRRLIEQGEDIYLLGIILQEVLQGIKRPDDFRTLRKYLDAFPLIALSRDDYVKAAALTNSLRRKGIQVSTVDALIASATIAHDCVLCTADRDSTHIARHAKLRLLEYE